MAAKTKDTKIFKGICLLGIVVTFALFGLALFSNPHFRPPLGEVIPFGIVALLTVSCVLFRELFNMKVSRIMEGLYSRCRACSSQ